MLLNKIEEYYYNYDEWGRLLRHRVEFELTKRALDKYIPPGSSVLDVGGGPGRYSIYLAGKGHKVTLVDLSEKLVKQAIENSKNAGVTVECIRGNALHLDKILPDRQYDAVLCMGPIYHLLEEAERKQAIDQCLARLKSGGTLFVSFISAYAPMLDCLKNYPQEIKKEKAQLIRYLYDGRYFKGPDDGFTDAYFFNPTEIGNFMAGFRLHQIKIMATDPFGTAEDKLLELSEDDFQCWIDLFEHVSANPEIWGCCEHLLYIGKKL